MHRLLFYNEFIIPLYMFRTQLCSKHVEVFNFNLITVQQDATIQFIIFLWAALHVSGVDTHHQELVPL